MTRTIAIVFLVLYAYNIAGYLAVFKTMQYHVRKEIKRQIKEAVPQKDLTLITIAEGEESALNWIKDNEFRYMGNLFDVVRYSRQNDTTYYYCVNDTQEELLFENLDAHVKTQMNADGAAQKTADLFKSTIKDHFPQSLTFSLYPPSGIVLITSPDLFFDSFTSDVLTPPPRIA
ncbi:MAG TPA: hypothetical protein VFG32_11950 [Bacteroidota bacterium]|nr:hypothetical protein [Bacteroidota bacterium]